ncbi:lytic transglycosylase domain-containing protein [Nonomuraea sp. B10E15]|uniref:aggregation-promoting factor C-terminal-like domain-containing protein n=1 Tax=Nonomuraea sp. B10E15 TaxID=3153560 RepID=UPI00325EC515
MDSKRALSTTLISVTALTAFGGAPARAETAPPAKTRAWTTPALPRTGIWTAPAQPETRLWTTPARPKTRVWTTTAQPKITAEKPASRNKRIALGQVVQRSWDLKQFRCLDNLWTRESNWNHRARNRSSGAYGIPQALPAGKMRGAGHDWRSNPETQIRWGLAYIKGRYGRPCGAWGHFRSHNWY